MRCVVLYVIALSSLLSATLSAEEGASLTLSETVSRILERSPQAAVSQLSVSSAYNTYRSQWAQALPQITFNLNPAYGVNWTKYPILNPFGIEVSNLEQFNQQVGAAVAVTQTLPTAGNLSLSLSNNTTLSKTGAGDSTQSVYYQTPKLSLTLSQPIFVNGRLLDMRLFPAALKTTELPYLKSVQQDLATRNTVLTQGIATYLTVVSLRRQLAQMTSYLAVERQRLDHTRLAQEKGRATQNDTLGAQINVDRQQEAILELEFSLHQSERALARMIGSRGTLESTKLSEELPAIAVRQGADELFTKVASQNPDVAQGRLDVENARMQAIIVGQNYAPSLTLSLSVAPQYGYNRPNSDQLDNSFSQLFDTANGANTDVTLSVGMQVPVYNGGRYRKDRAALEAGVGIAEKNLASKLATLKDNVDSLLLKQRYLGAKVSLTSENVELEQRRLEDQKRLRGLSSATDLDVETAEAGLEARRNELWSARVDLFLNSLDLLSLAGVDIAERLGKDGSR